MAVITAGLGPQHGSSRANVSQALARLKAAGLVRRQRKGRLRIYSLRAANLEQMAS